MKVQLVTKASGGTGTGSIEAGLADGVRHFDHHGPHSANPAPCCDERIRPFVNEVTVEITHLDADTFVGLLRMAGQSLPKVDFALMERIDLNGSSVCADKFTPTLLYMVGVGEVARGLKFPRPSVDGPIDVTALVEAMFAKTDAEIIEIGRVATVASEATYRECRQPYGASMPFWARTGRVGLWIVGANNPFDPSRPYEDGTEIVVVFRTHYASVSIYCAPSSEAAYGGKEVAGIQFAGHPKAAGSPRGTAITEAQARAVFDQLCWMDGCTEEATCPTCGYVFKTPPGIVAQCPSCFGYAE